MGVSMPVFVLGLLLAWFFGVVLRGTPFSLPPSGRFTAGIPRADDPGLGLTGLQGPLGAIPDFCRTRRSSTRCSPSVEGPQRCVAPPDAARIALGTIPLAIIARMTRSSLLDVLGLDYVRTARAKGLSERLVILRHGLRNALLPVVTVIGLSLGGLLSGAVLTETIFNLTGVGRTLVDAITGRDYPVIQGMTLVTAVMYLVVNLVVDMSYAYLDPRIRLS